MHHRTGARATAPQQLGPIYTGRRVLDAHGLPLGSISDVVFAPGEYLPEYLIVDPGLMRRSHCVPAAGARQTEGGDIVVAWERDWFRLAPPAAARPTLTPRERHALRAHYAARGQARPTPVRGALPATG